MATGNVPLLVAAESGDNMVKRGVVEVLIQENPIFEQIPWMKFAGNALQHSAEGTLPNVQFRNVNEGYSAGYGSDNQYFWGVSILGGEVKVDRALVNVIGTKEDIEARQWRKLAKSNAMRYSWEAIHGTGSVASKGFRGLYGLIDDGFGQEYEFSTTGTPIDALTDLDKLDEAIDMFRNQGQPDAALLHRKVRLQITHTARNSAGAFSLLDTGFDVLGRKVTTYDGIPLRVVGWGRNASGETVETFAFDEDPGDGGNDTSSILFVKYGDEDVTGLMGQNGTMYVESFGEMESAPQRLGRMEWYPGIASFNKYSVVRFSGITAS